MKQKPRYIIGIDEAGRGPLAGPVTVGVALTLRGMKLPRDKKFADSKKLSQKQREEWFVFIKNHPDIRFASASISAKIIDKIGISKATHTAISRALKKFKPIWGSDPQMREIEVLLDGLLHAPPEYKNQKTIIKGDEKIPAIALASIIAKVTRDRKMVQMAKKYPEYGFEIHKGYGTKEHYKKIKKHGMSIIHRKSFLKNHKSSNIK